MAPLLIANEATIIIIVLLALVLFGLSLIHISEPTRPY